MDVRKDAAEFLRSRRSRLSPEKAGLTAWGRNRRVTGLRREEVALLAGVSVEYYVRLERGNLGGASEAVLDSVADALQLDEAERAHLHDLARTSSTRAGARRPARPTVRPQVQWLLDSMTDTAAYVRNARIDILATNTLGRALYAPVFEMQGRPNVARFVFLDPRSRDFFIELPKVAGEAAALLRTLAGENPYDQGLTELVGELSTRSETFRTLWAAHEVRQHRTGVKRFHHPLVGDMTLSYESMEITADPGCRLNAYVAEPGSPSAQAFNLLASWARTPAASLVDARD
ncbi:MAG TPA: helix-turn-helix transcriptional regulator [Propionibacteriaceae bacterium]|nr:helix-turn-helix transcriptional regulator [Propionibacteriaceae bacterium]